MESTKDSTQSLPEMAQVVLVQKNMPANAGDVRDVGLIPGSGRFPGEGNGTPLQYSCLENPMDRGAWWATVLGSQRVRHNWRDSAHACNLSLEIFRWMKHSILESALSHGSHWVSQTVTHLCTLTVRSTVSTGINTGQCDGREWHCRNESQLRASEPHTASGQISTGLGALPSTSWDLPSSPPTSLGASASWLSHLWHCSPVFPLHRLLK